jgi:hypothetical protein
MTLDRDDAEERLARLEKLMREARGKSESGAESQPPAVRPKRPAPAKVTGTRSAARARRQSKKR